MVVEKEIAGACRMVYTACGDAERRRRSMSTDRDPGLSDKRLTEYFLRQKAAKERAEGAPEQVQTVPPVVTLSRQFGAGGHTVAEALIKRLGKGWDLWDRHLIDAVAASAEVRSEMVSAIDEKMHDWVTQTVRNILGAGGLDALAYKRHLVQVLLALAHQGRKVIVGRGSNFVLPQALNVRLEAALEFRVRATMERLRMGHDEAMALVLRSDRERADFSHGVFDRDVEDRAAYDMVLQTDSLGYAATTEVIVAAVRAVFGETVA